MSDGKTRPSDAHPLPAGETTWTSTRILLPEGAGRAVFRHQLTGELIPAAPIGRPAIAAAAAFATSPSALL
jgi:hypothetical protein